LQQLLSKLGFPQSTPTLIYFDSQSTIFWMKIPYTVHAINMLIYNIISQEKGISLWNLA
jgi:hypothetical protein